MSEAEISPAKCHRCGANLPENAPEGLCPRCVLALNLATETDIRTSDVGPHGTVTPKPLAAPPIPAAELASLFPQLDIIECLGRGGMGAVYKARQPRLDRVVALKILSPEKHGDPRFAERFQREARLLARLQHPNIVAVHDFGEVDGRFYLLMEFVDGVTLRQLMQTRKLPPEEALALVPRICEALQYAHQQGIVHRDIKPENILINKQGQVKIADFGIARLLDTQAQAQAGLTQEQVIGTPHYMAPEQVETPGKVDHRADIYSLGVVFYEMLTGELPLGKFPRPSTKAQMDVRLDDVVLRTLEKEPARRYQQVSEVKTEVETIAGSSARRSDEPMAARAVSGGPRQPPPIPKKRIEAWRWIVGGVIAVGVLVFAVVTATLIAFIQPEIYKSATRLRIQPIGVEFQSSHLQALADFVPNEVETIQSEVVLARVVERAELNNRWGRQFYGGRPLAKQAAVEILKKFIEVRPVRGTEILEVGVYSQDREEAAELANLIAQEYAAFCEEKIREHQDQQSNARNLGGMILRRVEVLDRATPSVRPARPEKMRMILVAAVIGGVVGSVLGGAVLLWPHRRIEAGNLVSR